MGNSSGRIGFWRLGWDCTDAVSATLFSLASMGSTQQESHGGSPGFYGLPGTLPSVSQLWAKSKSYQAVCGKACSAGETEAGE